MPTMDEALDALRNEREYQERLWGDKARGGRDNPGRLKSTTEWIAFMQNYLREAEDLTCRTFGPVADPKIVHIIRKVGAMAVACMEQHGAPLRDMKDLNRSCELHGVSCEE